jgi:hypothetical protein
MLIKKFKENQIAKGTEIIICSFHHIQVLCYEKKLLLFSIHTFKIIFSTPPYL